MFGLFHLFVDSVSVVFNSCFNFSIITLIVFQLCFDSVSVVFCQCFNCVLTVFSCMLCLTHVLTVFI